MAREREQPERYPSRLIGHVTEVDFDAGTAVLVHERGLRVPLTFGPGVGWWFEKFPRTLLALTGELVPDEGTFAVATVDPSAEIYRKATFNQLAREQGAKPIQSVEELRIPGLTEEDAHLMLEDLALLKKMSRGE
jgi:hypothetical protein